MKTRTMKLTVASAFVLALAACSNGPTSGLTGYARGTESVSADSLAVADNTQQHSQDPNTGENGITDPHAVQVEDLAVGSPEVVARLHGCSKITYASLGSILSGRGVSLAAGGKNAPATAGSLYATGGPALGVASYPGRVPEAIIASTSALAKQFDVFVLASGEIQTNLANSTACPGTSITDATGAFTRDGISCILGKPATAAHVTLANQVVAQASDAATGVKLAISALLEAAHTCE